MQPAKYRYYIDDVEVFPHTKDLVKEFRRENDEQYFSVSITGDIVLWNADAKKIFTANLDKEFKFVITKDGATYYTARFTKSDCDMDFSTCNCKIKLTTDDAYSLLEAKAENEYDLMKLSIDRQNLKMTKHPAIQVYVPGENSIGCIKPLTTYWETEVVEATENTDLLKNKYHFAEASNFKNIVVNPSGGSPAIIATTYIGALEETSFIEELGGGAIQETQRQFGTFRPIINTSYVIYVQFDKVINRSSTGSPTTYRTSLYQIKHESKNEVYFQYRDGNVQDESRWLNDTFTVSAVSGEASGSFSCVYSTKPIFARFITDSDTYNVSSPTFDIPVDDIAENNFNYRKCAPFEVSSRAENIFTISLQEQAEATRWGINDNGKYFLPPKKGVLYVPIAKNIWTNISYWFDTSKFSYVKNKYNSMVSTVIVKDTYEIASCINALLKEMKVNLTFAATTEYSEFLFSETNPVSGYYVRLYLTQITNILKSNYDQPAQKMPTSFKSIMDMLAQTMKCYWFVENGKLRIENIAYFLNGGSYSQQNEVSVDLTSTIDLRTRLQLDYAQSQFSYEKEDLVSRYEFEFSNGRQSEGFEGRPINVNNKYCKDSKKESISVGNFAADVDMMMLDPSEFSNDGIAVLAATKDANNNLSVSKSIVKLSDSDQEVAEFEETVNNAYFSWPFLEEYYMYDISGSDIEIEDFVSINGKFLNPKGTLRILKQEVRFPVNEDLDPYKLIKTGIGNGVATSIKINLDKRQVTATLIYKPF